MRYKTLLACCICVAALTGCSGDDDDDDSSGGTTIADTDLVLPEQLEVVSAKTSDANQGPTFLALAPATSGAFLNSGTEYSNAQQRTHVWIEALEPLSIVDGILCFVSQFRPETQVNQGAYAVLATPDECFDNGDVSDDDGSNQSSASGNDVSYVEVIVNATRENDSAPLIVNAWIPEMPQGDDGDNAIRIRGEINEGANDSDPFGSFTLTYQFAATIDAADPGSQGRGQLSTVETLDGFQGFTLYESSLFGTERFTTSASVVLNPTEDNGVALTAIEADGTDMGSQSQAFAVAYDSDHLLLQNANRLSALGYRSGDNASNTACLNRDSFNEVVWRYGLYNVSGTEVDINSGFPFKYDSDSNGSYESRGFVGYWGIWTEDDNAISNGTTIEKEVFSEGAVAEQYTVVSAPGRLLKNTVQQLALTELDGVQFDYFDNGNFVVEYSSTQSDFVKVGSVTWGEQGRTITEISPATALAVTSNTPIFMYSEQLGGGVQYVGGQSFVTFFQQEFVNGDETAAGELFAGGTATLSCLTRCPKAGITTSDLTTFSGPYKTDASTVGGAHSYSISNTGTNALTLLDSSQPVVYPSGADTEDPTNLHQWGLRSGPMVTDISGLANVWDIFNPSNVTTFYEWETGPNQWNQQYSIRSVSDSTIVSFDKPISFIYRHENANDRSGSAGSFDGQTILLNYGGNGDLWGIPSLLDSERAHYAPAFNIADAVLMGPNNIYAIKALEIEQKMQQDPGACSDLVLNDPAAPVPTEVTGTLNNDIMPTVTDAPIYIGGEPATE